MWNGLNVSLQLWLNKDPWGALQTAISLHRCGGPSGTQKQICVSLTSVSKSIGCSVVERPESDTEILGFMCSCYLFYFIHASICSTSKLFEDFPLTVIKALRSL